MATIQELAQQYRDRFTLYKRSEDDVIWTRKDNRDDEALERHEWKGVRAT